MSGSRTNVQTIVDKRFDRARYDAQRMVDAFSERLRQGVDISSPSDDLKGTFHAALHPAMLEYLWLRS